MKAKEVFKQCESIVEKIMSIHKLVEDALSIIDKTSFEGEEFKKEKIIELTNLIDKERNWSVRKGSTVYRIIGSGIGSELSLLKKLLADLFWGDVLNNWNLSTVISKVKVRLEAIITECENATEAIDTLGQFAKYYPDKDL